MFTLAILLAFSGSAGPVATTTPATRSHVIESYGKLPLSFEANQGQTDRRVKFLSRGSGYTLFLTQDSAVFSLHGKKTNAALRMKVLGANPHAAVAGTDGLPGKSNYFVGNDPRQWRTNVPTYASVKYTEVYPGIDLVYHGNQRLLEYDFMVAPGADPRAIELRFHGAKRLTVNPDGALVIGIGDNEVIEHAPVVYQEIGGRRRALPGRYVLRGRGRVGFSVAGYDREQPLVIDPTLVYSTYLGESDSGEGIAVDSSGNAYVTGGTGSSNFPTTSGAFQTTSAVGPDVFVTKLNATGSALVYSTYFGGSGSDGGVGIAVDTSGNAYVTGYTYGSGKNNDFPVTPGAFQTTYGGGFVNSFVTKLNATGSALVYSTYLGGNDFDWANTIVVDGAGDAFVTGYSESPDFPTTPGAFQTAHDNGTDAFVTKLNASGSALVYSTLLGGNLGNVYSTGWGIAVDASGNAYVTDHISETNFPTTPGSYQACGREDAFVSKLNASGSALLYSTCLGGSTPGNNWGLAVAVDASLNTYVIGVANADFPSTPGAFQTAAHGRNNAFVTKLNATGTAVLYSTYLGGSGGELGAEIVPGTRIAVDASGNAYVTGVTYSPDFPTTPDAFQAALGGVSNAFVSKLNAEGSALLYSTFLGGSGAEGNAIAIDAAGNVYLTGDAYGPGSSSDFPTTPGAYQTTYGGFGAAFVAKLNLGISVNPPITTAVLNGPAGNDGWYLGTVSVTLSVAAGSNPVSATYYKVDTGAYQAYGAPFSIAGDGSHQFLFYSVDTAGNQETPHGQTMKIDSTPPVSHVAALPGTAFSPNFSVQWSGSDATSGLVNYTIYVSDGTGLIPWLTQTTATQAWFAGYLGHTYRFYSAARDIAGNVEVKTVADATTTVPAQMAADVNGDGQINCLDIAIVKASFGKKTGQPGFDPRADVNHDGIVDIRDLAAVSQKLIPGTTCP
ncbi:MAG TPA: SBBP repeat-containing protein [Bryobacteraceae bacterium]|nr:SBBP repeat-containing protein [Bryobacteraceae bacterium]